jgi:cell division protein FtsL
MAPLPMTKEREEEIKQKKALERKAKFRKSMTVLIGMGAAMLFIVIFVIVYMKIRGL